MHQTRLAEAVSRYLTAADRAASTWAPRDCATAELAERGLRLELARAEADVRQSPGVDPPKSPMLKSVLDRVKTRLRATAHAFSIEIRRSRQR